MCNATKVKRAIRLRDKAIQETPDSPVKKHLRSASTSARAISVYQKHLPTCFFCDETTEEMHRAATMHIDASIRKKAIIMKDTKLLSKLSAGDHKNCLTSFYDRYRSHQRLSVHGPCHIAPEALAFAEVMSYIGQHDQPGGEANHVLKLSEITALHLEHLHALGGSASERKHSTRLVNRLQRHIPALKVHQSKAGAVLTFKKNVGDAIVSACLIAPEDEAIMLMRAQQN